MDKFTSDPVKNIKACPNSCAWPKLHYIFEYCAPADNWHTHHINIILINEFIENMIRTTEVNKFFRFSIMHNTL